MPGMEKVSCVVIGTGAVGLAIARTISKTGVSTFVLERHPMLGMDNSSRNSEVLHAGLYYPKGSNKANLCLKGRQLMLDYLQQMNIPHKQCGKLVIATTDDESKTLQQIYRNATRNGLTELSLLHQEDIKLIEPQISCTSAILSPFTGIMDSHSLMVQYEADIDNSQTGSMVVYNCDVQRIEHSKCDITSTQNLNGKSSSGAGCEFEFTIHTNQGSIRCDYLVNAAGLYAPQLAHQQMSSFFPSNLIPPTYYCKGNYYKLQGVSNSATSSSSSLFQHLVYPVPEAGGLGIHATLDLQGGVRFGPDVEWIRYQQQQQNIEDLDQRKHFSNSNSRAAEKRHQKEDLYLFPPGVAPYTNFNVNTSSTSSTDDTDTDVDADDGSGNDNNRRREVFFQAIRKYWPAVRREWLVPDYAGIRPKLTGPDSSRIQHDNKHDTTTTTTTTTTNNKSSSSSDSSIVVGSADFVLMDTTQHHIPNLVCLFGIESPGLTASLAIGEEVKRMLHIKEL